MKSRKSSTTEAVAQAKSPSESALASARAMRGFDPNLTDDAVVVIAIAIDENAVAGASLNPKKKRLRNAAEPVTMFVVKPR